MDLEPRSDDGTLPTDCPLKQWYGDLKNAMRRAGRSIQYSTMSKDMLNTAGYQDVTEKVIQIPLNEWHPNPHKKMLGSWYTCWLDEEALQGLSMQPFTQLMGMTPDEVRAAVGDAVQDVRRHNYHAYHEL